MCGKFRDKLIDTRLAGHMPVHDATSVCPAHGLEACHGHKTSGVQPPCERDHIPQYQHRQEFDPRVLQQSIGDWAWRFTFRPTIR